MEEAEVKNEENRKYGKLIWIRLYSGEFRQDIQRDILEKEID